MNWEPLLRHLDCRREAVGHLQPPEPLDGVAPGGGRAGHGDGVDVEGGQGVACDAVVGPHAVQVEGGGAAAGAVEAAYLREKEKVVSMRRIYLARENKNTFFISHHTYLSRFGVVVEAECVAADAGGAGLRQVQHGRHRHARVSRVPARLQDGGAATEKKSPLFTIVFLGKICDMFLDIPDAGGQGLR